MVAIGNAGPVARLEGTTMLFIYKTTAGSDATGAILKLLAAGDRAYVAVNVLLYSGGGSVFQLSGGNRVDVAGELVSLNNTVYSFSGAATGNIVNVLASGTIASATASAIAVTVGGTSVSNAGSITGVTAISLVGNANAIVNGGAVTGEIIAVQLGNYQTDGDNTLTNTGTIAATGFGGRAIRLDGQDGAVTHIINSGAIVASGGIAVSIAFLGDNALDLNNSGTISGAISLGLGADAIVNSGDIAGRIDLEGGDDLFDGSAGTSRVVVDGGDGDDELRGGRANDLLSGGFGADLIDGGAGFDTASYDASYGAVVDLADSGLNDGAALGDVLTAIEALRGSTDRDVFAGADGNETLSGIGGADVLSGRGGDDTLRGGDDNDTLDGGAGNDRLIGGDGIDTASYASATKAVAVRLGVIGSLDTGGAGRDLISSIENVTGSRFDDTLAGDGTANVLRGGAGADKLSGGDGDDLLAGDAGDDTLTGGAGFDTADYGSATTAVTVTLASTAIQNTGGGGNDRLSAIEGLIGSAFNDLLTGSGAANRIDGGGGDDTLAGGDGDDVLRGGEGTDALGGGAGFDVADYAGAEAGVRVRLAVTAAQNTLGAGTDTLTGIEGVYGSALADALTGDANDNLFRGGEGDDTINGGAGFDTASYADASVGVTVSLSIAGAQDTGAGSDTLTAIENLTGSAFADTLTGTTGANVLSGGEGSDTLNGLGGDDRFIGSFGSDILSGGNGFDTADYSALDIGISVDLAASQPQVILGFFNIQQVNDVEAFIGTTFSDTFVSGPTINTYTGGGGADRFQFGPGTAAQNTITDFSGAGGDGDKLVFVGYDANATFTRLDATHFEISDSSRMETITFTNAPTINVATDVQFVG